MNNYYAKIIYQIKLFKFTLNFKEKVNIFLAPAVFIYTNNGIESQNFHNIKN